MAARDPLSECTGFDWDESTALKSWEKHKVTPEEAEDIFFGEPLAVRSDTAHSSSERRYSALGQTARGRLLYVAFTIRRKKIRVISAGNMNRKEAAEYRRHEKNSSV
jgi:uncharacterized protein